MIRKNAKRLSAAFIATFIGVLVWAGAAQAYIAKSCYVVVTQARLSVTAWQLSSNPAYSRMHMDLNSYIPSSGFRLYAVEIELDGVPTSEAGTNDIYRNVKNTIPHTVRGWWRDPQGNVYTCYVYGASGVWK